MGLYDLSAKAIDGSERKLSDYRGKLALVVNVASKCGFTPQYEGLEELWQKYRDQGLVVLGFPCDQFGHQEPGNEEQIQSFCSTTYGVSFPMFSKIEVNGGGRAPLYEWLTGERTQPDGPGDIRWNFTKFLIGRDGRVVARFAPTTAPVSEEIVTALEEQLG